MDEKYKMFGVRGAERKNGKHDERHQRLINES